jgi:kynurenine formamidase
MFPVGVRDWRREFEEQFGTSGGSDRTAEKVSLAETCGWSRVIDVSHLVGTIERTKWPASPEITVEVIKRYEAMTGPLRPDEIVLLRSGHTDRTFKPFGEGKACMAAPLAGESEGWPALSADAVGYLHARGIRCVGTDSPTLGGVNEKQALLTYWALGSHDIIGVEFLTNLGALPDKAFPFSLRLKSKAATLRWVERSRSIEGPACDCLSATGSWLGAIARRLEILDGYLIAYLNLDEVIRIIREEDEPKPRLMERFGLNDTQAEAILNMRLRALRRLEEMEIRKEHKKLSAEQKKLQALMKSEAARWETIAEEIESMRARFGDGALGARRGAIPG